MGDVRVFLLYGCATECAHSLSTGFVARIGMGVPSVFWVTCMAACKGNESGIQPLQLPIERRMDCVAA